MEKCKFCQAELAENGTFCPSCGRNNAEEIQEQTVPAAEETVAVESASEQEAPAEEISSSEQAGAEETAEKPAEKKVTPGKIALAVGAIAVLAALLIALIAGGSAKPAAETPEQSAPDESVSAETIAYTVPADGDPEGVTCKGSYTLSDEEVISNRETVVASIGDNTLTNGQLQVYYWSMVNSYLSSEYGYYAVIQGALDYTRPLDTQFSGEDQTLTWQQYFLKEALSYWQMCTALKENAKLSGVEMRDEDQAYLANMETTLADNAASYGMTVEELMRHNVGPGAGVEEFIDFQRIYLEGKDYYEGELEKLVPTQEELEAFFAEHQEDYAAMGVAEEDLYVNVRHILVKVEGGTTDESGAVNYSDEEWAACKAEAQAILDTWLAGDKTEDSFAALANEKSEDPGSNTNGGLYENVYKGQMVEPFETWCFDEARAYGDYGLVQTSYGYHVMFYVSSEPVWITYVENDVIAEKSSAFLNNLVERYPMEVAYDKISLGFIDLNGN